MAHLSLDKSTFPAEPRKTKTDVSMVNNGQPLKMKKTLLLISLAALALASCGSVSGFTTTTEERYTESRELEVSTPAQFTPVKGYLDVNPTRIKETFHFSAEEIAALGGGDVEKIKARASFMVLDKYAADELVSPLFDISSNPDGSFTVVVMGYTGKLVFTK